VRIQTQPSFPFQMNENSPESGRRRHIMCKVSHEHILSPRFSFCRHSIQPRIFPRHDCLWKSSDRAVSSGSQRKSLPTLNISWRQRSMSGLVSHHVDLEREKHATYATDSITFYSHLFLLHQLWNTISLNVNVSIVDHVAVRG